MKPCSKFCPFSACSSCIWQGQPSLGDYPNTPATWENSLVGSPVKASPNETAPAGNRGLTTPTSKES